MKLSILIIFGMLSVFYNFSHKNKTVFECKLFFKLKLKCWLLAYQFAYTFPIQKLHPNAYTGSQCVNKS